MTYLDVRAQTRKTGPALLAGFALLIAGAATIGSVDLFGVRMGFGFIPLLVLILWPRRADSLVSLNLVFLTGLFTDWAAGGLIGQWALVYVLTWGFFRSETRSSPFAPVGLFLVWLAVCALTIIVLTLSGYFVFRILPDFSAFGRQMILASLLLPAMLLLRHGLAVRFSDGEDWR